MTEYECHEARMEQREVDGDKCREKAGLPRLPDTIYKISTPLPDKASKEAIAEIDCT